MPRNAELDQLKAKQQEAFERKQAAWTAYDEVRKNAEIAYEAMQQAWQERAAARDIMNREYEDLQASSNHYREVWDEYGDRSEASSYAAEGHEHKGRRNELHAEVADLCREVKEARQRAEWNAPQPDSSAFRAAREEFQRLKERHEALQAEFQSKLEEVKAKRQREREHALDVAGVRMFDWKDAKVVKKADGTTQVYSGGLGKGDGSGHVHTVINSSGQKTYQREAFAAHGKQNVVQQKDRGWYPIERGVVGDSDHVVTFRQGWGRHEGETLIADGYLSGNKLTAGHNHYGDNDKNLYPNEADRIEDSEKHKNDKYYTDHGH